MLDPAYKCCKDCTDDSLHSCYLLKTGIVWFVCKKHIPDSYTFPPYVNIPFSNYVPLPGSFQAIEKRISKQEAEEAISLYKMRQALQ